VVDAASTVQSTLAAKPALGGIHREFNGVTLDEITDHGLLSIAAFRGQEKTLAKVLASEYKIKIPAVGHSTVDDSSGARFLGLQTDQCMVLFFDEANALFGKRLRDKLATAAWLTDQSDSWVMLRINGPLASAALERICLIDLHPDVFGEGQVTRTVMEHMATIILRESVNSWLLMSPRSSAHSFLHALETSVHNVI
jgi:sarcosine oxidase subunit gamma